MTASSASQIPVEKSEPISFTIEEKQQFSKSSIWSLQKDYYEAMGFEAWRQGAVPHYITSNPVIANSYAEVIFTFYKEQIKLPDNSKFKNEPLYVVELGSGSGRFSFQLLNRLKWLCEQSNIPLNSFKYVLTDFVPANLQFLKNHPRFRHFFESGVLDMSIFDIVNSESLELQLSGETIDRDQLNRPLICINNYVLDSIPNDLIFCTEGEVKQCVVSLTSSRDPNEINCVELLQHLSCTYEYDAQDNYTYTEDYLNELVEFYRTNIRNSYVLLPTSGLRCLDRLRSLSNQGLMILSADKGDYIINALENNAAPQLVHHHGCFSLNVNYHAIKYCCELKGALTFFPEHHHNNLMIGLVLWVKNADQYVETALAYKTSIQEFSVDDYFSLIRHAQENISTMSAENLLSYIRLSQFDGQQLAYSLPRFTELIPALYDSDLEDIIIAINKTWEQYYPLGEYDDLANQIATFLYEINVYDLALFYFSESAAIYGADTGTLYNMAACHKLLNQFTDAELLLKNILENDPENNEAATLLNELKDEAKQKPLYEI